MVSTVVGLIIAWSGFLVGVIKWLLARMIKGLEEQISASNQDCMDKWLTLENNHKQLESRFINLLERLPLDYQRREDAIREYTVINSKLDRQYGLMVENKQK